MDFDSPRDDDPRRREIRSWLAAHPNPSAHDLLDRGLIVPHWPAPYGLDADADPTNNTLTQAIINLRS